MNPETRDAFESELAGLFQSRSEGLGQLPTTEATMKAIASLPHQGRGPLSSLSIISALASAATLCLVVSQFWGRGNASTRERPVAESQKPSNLVYCQYLGVSGQSGALQLPGKSEPLNITMGESLMGFNVVEVSDEYIRFEDDSAQRLTLYRANP